MELCVAVVVGCARAYVGARLGVRAKTHISIFTGSSRGVAYRDAIVGRVSCPSYRKKRKELEGREHPSTSRKQITANGPACTLTYPSVAAFLNSSVISAGRKRGGLTDSSLIGRPPIEYCTPRGLLNARHHQHSTLESRCQLVSIQQKKNKQCRSRKKTKQCATDGSRWWMPQGCAVTLPRLLDQRHLPQEPAFNLKKPLWTGEHLHVPRIRPRLFLWVVAAAPKIYAEIFRIPELWVVQHCQVCRFDDERQFVRMLRS